MRIKIIIYAKHSAGAKPQGAERLAEAKRSAERLAESERLASFERKKVTTN
jgi:hypothetical protein